MTNSGRCIALSACRAGASTANRRNAAMAWNFGRRRVGRSSKELVRNDDRRCRLIKGRMRNLISVATALISAGFLYACGGGGSSEPVPVSVSVRAASSKPIDGGQSIPVYATVSGGSGSLDVTWTISCQACGSMAHPTSASGAPNAFQAAAWNPNEPRTAPSLSQPHPLPIHLSQQV